MEGHRKHGQVNLLEGTPKKAILAFALPLLGSSLVQQLYSTVDRFFIGRFVGTRASAAVGAGDLLVTCLIGLFTGISAGTGVTAAQVWGAKDRKRFHTIIQTAVAFGFLGATVLLALGECLVVPALKLINTPEEILSQAALYLRIYFLSMFSIVLYNLCSGVIRAVGDSKSALKFQIIGGIANVIADYVMIVIFDLGVAGGALATFASQTCAAGLTLRYLMKLEPDIRLDLKTLKISPIELSHILRIGIPSGLQSMTMTLSNIIVQSVINGMGVITISAFTVYFKLELFLWYPIVSIGQALVTYTAQNYGAGLHDRIRRGLKESLMLSIPFTLMLSLLLLALSRQAFGLFNPDPDVVTAGVKIASVTFPLYFIYTIQDTFASMVRGKGKALSPMIISIICICILRVTMLYLLTGLSDDIRAIAAVYPASWGFTAIGMGFLYMKDLRN